MACKSLPIVYRQVKCDGLVVDTTKLHNRFTYCHKQCVSLGKGCPKKYFGAVPDYQMKWGPTNDQFANHFWSHALFQNSRPTQQKTELQFKYLLWSLSIQSKMMFSMSKLRTLFDFNGPSSQTWFTQRPPKITTSFFYK